MNLRKGEPPWPRLSYSAQAYVLARDPSKGRILLGGLGGLGVGQMWFNEDERHKEYPGYADAPAKEAA